MIGGDVGDGDEVELIGGDVGDGDEVEFIGEDVGEDDGDKVGSFSALVGIQPV